MVWMNRQIGEFHKPIIGNEKKAANNLAVFDSHPHPIFGDFLSTAIEDWRQVRYAIGVSCISSANTWRQGIGIRQLSFAYTRNTQPSVDCSVISYLRRRVGTPQ